MCHEDIMIGMRRSYKVWRLQNPGEIVPANKQRSSITFVGPGAGLCGVTLVNANWVNGTTLATGQLPFIGMLTSGTTQVTLTIEQHGALCQEAFSINAGTTMFVYEIIDKDMDRPP